MMGTAQREKLDKRLAGLEAQALSLEERVVYAEREAELRGRVREAQRRIQATQPSGLLDGLMPAGGLWRRLPTPLKFLSVVVSLVVVLLLIGKACAGSG